MEKQQVLAAAIGGLLTLGLAGNASAHDSKMELEKCYGIAKAGMNDCGGKKTGHSCAGQSAKDGDPNNFIEVPKGSCNKITNGKLSTGGEMSMKKGK